MEYVGYWNNILKDNNLIPEYEEVLEHITEKTKMCAMDFLHGFCTVYAYFLAVQDSMFGLRTLTYEGQLVHTYCTYHDAYGRTWFLDIRGATTDTKKFFEEFEVDVDEKGILGDDWYDIEVYSSEIEFDQYYSYYGIKLEKEAIESARIFVSKFLEESGFYPATSNHI